VFNLLALSIGSLDSTRISSQQGATFSLVDHSSEQLPNLVEETLFVTDDST
jgi:hypothetical protein